MKIKIQNLSLLILASIWLVLQVSCVPEENLQNIVVTEDVLFVSGENVRLTGRVIETTGKVDDHGFQISLDENFSAPIIVSLGEKPNGLGRFVGFYNQLAFGTPYFYRSYANVGGNEVVGQTKEFKSLKPRIDNFFPFNGVEGDRLIINGINLGQDTRVFIDNREVTIKLLESESIIEVDIPEILNNATVEIQVEVQDTVMSFTQQFTYHIGVWQLETTFPDNTQLYESMFFRDGDQFVVGLGWEKEPREVYSEVWGLDLLTNSWSNLSFPGTTAGVRQPFSSGGYWGSGRAVRIGFEADLNLSPFFWQYSFGNFVQKSFLSFRLYKSVGITLDDNLFVFGGVVAAQSTNFTYHKFNVLTDSWLELGQAQYNISSDFPYFSYKNEAYFLLEDKNIIRYNPFSDSWEIVGQYPSNVRAGGGAVVINDKVYIGLFGDDPQMWELNLLTMEWTKKNDFTGQILSVNNGFFGYNNKVYFFRSVRDSGQPIIDPRMELWSLDPNKLK